MGSERTHGKQLFAICSSCINRFLADLTLVFSRSQPSQPTLCKTLPRMPQAMPLCQWLFELFAQIVLPRDLFIPGRHPCRAYARWELVRNLATCHCVIPASRRKGRTAEEILEDPGHFCLRMYLKPNVLLALLLLLANAVQASVRVGLDEPRPIQQRFYT